MPIWSSVDDVRRRVTYGEITPTSAPTEDDVSGWLDDAEAETRAALRACEIRDTFNAGTDADAIRILAKHVVDYATGTLKLAWASASGDEDNADGQPLVDAYQARLVDLFARPGVWAAMLEPSGQAPRRTLQARSHTSSGDEVSEPVYSINDRKRAL